MTKQPVESSLKINSAPNRPGQNSIVSQLENARMNGGISASPSNHGATAFANGANLGSAMSVVVQELSGFARDIHVMRQAITTPSPLGLPSQASVRVVSAETNSNYKIAAPTRAAANVRHRRRSPPSVVIIRQSESERSPSPIRRSRSRSPFRSPMMHRSSPLASISMDNYSNVRQNSESPGPAPVEVPSSVDSRHHERDMNVDVDEHHNTGREEVREREEGEGEEDKDHMTRVCDSIQNRPIQFMKLTLARNVFFCRKNLNLRRGSRT